MADRTDKDRRNRRRKLNTKGRLKTGSRMKDRFSDGLWFSGRCSDGLKPRPLPRTGGGGRGKVGVGAAVSDGLFGFQAAFKAV